LSQKQNMAFATNKNRLNTYWGEK